MWTFGLDQWKARNNLLYGETDDEKAEILIKEADKVITEFSEHSDKIKLADRSLVQLPLHVCKQRHMLLQKCSGLKWWKLLFRLGLQIYLKGLAMALGWATPSLG